MIYKNVFWTLLPRRKDDSEVLDIAKKAIEKFPDSKFANDWLFRGVCRFQSKDSFNDYLEYLKEKFPNTVVGNAAKQELEKVKKEPKQNKLKDQ